MRKEKLIPGEYYHLYNRGVDRNDIFFTAENWNYFLDRVRHYFTPSTCDILAYCLMPNHYHLLTRIKIEDFGLKVMHPFSTSYTKAINKQQNRVGSLFQGSFQFRHVESDEDLLHLSRYIHRNPIEAGFVETPEDWAYSSYSDYLDMRDSKLVNTTLILTMFDNLQNFIHFTLDIDEDSIAQQLLID